MFKTGLFVSIFYLFTIASADIARCNIEVRVLSIDLRAEPISSSNDLFGVYLIECKEKFPIKPFTSQTDFDEKNGLSQASISGLNFFDNDPTCKAVIFRKDATLYRKNEFIVTPGVYTLINKRIFSIPLDEDRPEILAQWLKLPITTSIYDFFYNLFQQDYIVGADWVLAPTVQIKSFTNPKEMLTMEFK